MSHKRFFIRKVAILGAGVMGAQIAAHFANVNVEPILFDLPAKEGDPNALVKQALLALKTLQPSPLALESLVHRIIPANYEHDLSLLKDCDLIIEAISERLDWKIDLYQKIIPFLSESTFLVSNTSGLSIEKLGAGLSSEQRAKFCGIHFFNPPRYMPLVELIPHPSTDRILLEQLESFLVSSLGKGVVCAKDTPNFIGNRIGVFSTLSTLIHADQFGLMPDSVDLITGLLIGRPKSATCRTLDIVGLDTFASVVHTMTEGLSQDPWHAHYSLPAWMTALIRKGALGQKTNAGIYKKVKNEILVIDKQGTYRPLHQKVNPELLAILQTDSPLERFSKLRESHLNEAKFLWAIMRDLFHYSAYHLASIAETCRDVDLTMRWGYGWQQGPFELWQSIGWKTVIQWIEEDIKQKKTLNSTPLPSWVYEIEEVGVYKSNTAFSPLRKIYLGRSKLPVYQRQIFSDRVIGEQEDLGKTLFETDEFRMWSTGDDIAIASFKTKHNTITVEVLEGIQEAIKRAEAECRALILWQKSGNDFSFGANLKLVQDFIAKGQIQQLSKIVKLFQQTALALRYAHIPTIAATRGKVLGGGCELMMHCTRTVAALESYPGLVEVSVGLIPAGAGCKEMALRASLETRFDDPFQIIRQYFNTVASALIAKSAFDAKRIGFLKESDEVVVNPHEILYVAKQQAWMLSESNYRPPLKRKISVSGKSGCATLQVGLINLREGGLISDHDYIIGSGLAQVMCGGEVEGGLEVSEEWLLELERQLFMDLVQTKKTQDRIAYMLEHGKPLRN